MSANRTLPVPNYDSKKAKPVRKKTKKGDAYRDEALEFRHTPGFAHGPAMDFIEDWHRTSPLVAAVKTHEKEFKLSHQRSLGEFVRRVRLGALTLGSDAFTITGKARRRDYIIRPLNVDTTDIQDTAKKLIHQFNHLERASNSSSLISSERRKANLFIRETPLSIIQYELKRIEMVNNLVDETDKAHAQITVRFDERLKKIASGNLEDSANPTPLPPPD